MNSIILNNGVAMPQVGMGTFLIPKEEIERTIMTAYDLGYRQFDTAWRYHNEADIVSALKKHGVNREDYFITTKVNIDALYYGGYKYGLKHINIRSKSIQRAVEESFDNLQTDYIDLFLVHYPWHLFIDMWEVLEKYYKAGRIRAIGVSNFLQPHIEAIKEVSDITPAVNQFEISPLNTQKELIKYCRDNNIAVEAMSTFSHFRSVEPRLEIINNPVIAEIARKHQKSTVQIVLRWLVQQNIIVIPKTWKKEHLIENISVFDFELSDDEIKSIDMLDQGKFLNYNPYVAKKGLPIKYRSWEGFEELKKYPESYINMPKWKRKIIFG